MVRFVGRENVRKRLAPFEGEQGRTSYANGVVRIELPGAAVSSSLPSAATGERSARYWQRVRSSAGWRSGRSRGSSPSPSRVVACSSACPTTSIRPSSPPSRDTIDPRPTAVSTSAVLDSRGAASRCPSRPSGRRGVRGRRRPGFLSTSRQTHPLPVNSPDRELALAHRRDCVSVTPVAFRKIALLML